MRHLIRIVLLLALLAAYSPVYGQGDSLECTEDNVREWMIQRQVGRNKVQPILEGEVQLFDSLLLVQQVRRDLEDSPRPACADELYYLTIFLYNTISDALTVAYGQNLGIISEAEIESIDFEARYSIYTDNVEEIYAELEDIAGIDVMATAAEIEPVPTTVATSTPLPPPSLETTEDGNIVAQGSGSFVFDPIDIATGLYRVTFSTDDYGVASIEQISGSCGYLSLSTDVSGGSTEQGTFRSADCRAVIEVEYTDSAWTLSFEPLK
jgi:hypothetical protein